MEGKTNYEILTPNNMVENKAEDALKFALENEQVKNIAITGQYSSGKSSIIQSYFSKYVDKKDYLNISLATFEKKENEATPIEESNSLEKVIIEKLYYSILNKYDLQRDIISSLITIVLVAFINVGIYLFNMESINNSLTNNFWITLIFMGLEIICLTGLIGYSISYVINLQKIKLKFGDVEVEVNQTGNNQEKNRNLLNEEIEFIVKTMNIAKYKYIIFEDLDRFQNPQIFERLRDLNITLNATLKEKVKFLYAIKDEMFIADNRTKFFDFIIPIVPYVSYENSGEELLKIIKKHQLDTELSEDFILDISLYVSDIRILKNTVNEYIVYKKSLDKKIYDCEKLFSILLYKNTCSEDFAKLQRKQGEIYNCFLKKNEKINEYIEKNKEKIEEKNNEYSEIEKNLISEFKRKSTEIAENLRKERTKAIENLVQEERIKVYDEYDKEIKNVEKGYKKIVKNYLNQIPKKDCVQYYKEFIDSYLQNSNEVMQYLKENTLANLKKNEVSFEDLAPIMYIQFKVFGIKDKCKIKHVVIDEAQDYGEFQFDVLKTILNSNSMTILGDIAQGVHYYRGIENWKRFIDVEFNNVKTVYTTLNKTYRTTKEIMDIANIVINKLPEYEKEYIVLGDPVIDRKNSISIKKVENRKDLIESINEKINEHLDNGYKSIAIIGKDMKECEMIEREICKLRSDVKLIRGKDSEYQLFHHIWQKVWNLTVLLFQMQIM